MKLSKKQLELLEKIGDLQMNIANEIGETPNSFVAFEHEGTHVIHPTRSECSRFEVDPVDYYGQNFLRSAFMDFIKDSSYTQLVERDFLKKSKQ